jgi:hypothetical protein
MRVNRPGAAAISHEASEPDWPIESVESAVSSYVSFENACQTQLLAEAAGTIKPISLEVARHTAGQARGEDPGAYGFRPLWERVLREQPDFLESAGAGGPAPHRHSL